MHGVQVGSWPREAAPVASRQAWPSTNSSLTLQSLSAKVCTRRLRLGDVYSTTVEPLGVLRERDLTYMFTPPRVKVLPHRLPERQAGHATPTKE